MHRKTSKLLKKGLKRLKIEANTLIVVVVVVVHDLNAEVSKEKRIRAGSDGVRLGSSTLQVMLIILQEEILDEFVCEKSNKKCGNEELVGIQLLNCNGKGCCSTYDVAMLGATLTITDEYS